jgi:hypothetical protein
MAKEYLYPSLLKRLTLDKNARDAREYKVWTSEQLSEDVKQPTLNVCKILMLILG